MVTAGGRHELVVSTRGFLSGYDPQTGSRLWYCQAIEDYVCPSVIAHDDVVYAIGGRSNTAVAVKAGGKGDVTKTHLLWTLGKGSNVSSPVYYQGHLYWASESNGTVYCVKASDGTLVYTERLQPGSDRIYASATVGDGKIYYVSRERAPTSSRRLPSSSNWRTTRSQATAASSTPARRSPTAGSTCARIASSTASVKRGQ